MILFYSILIEVQKVSRRWRIKSWLCHPWPPLQDTLKSPYRAPVDLKSFSRILWNRKDINHSCYSLNRLSDRKNELFVKSIANNTPLSFKTLALKVSEVLIFIYENIKKLKDHKFNMINRILLEKTPKIYNCAEYFNLVFICLHHNSYWNNVQK